MIKNQLVTSLLTTVNDDRKARGLPPIVDDSVTRKKPGDGPRKKAHLGLSDEIHVVLQARLKQVKANEKKPIRKADQNPTP